MTNSQQFSIFQQISRVLSHKLTNILLQMITINVAEFVPALNVVSDTQITFRIDA